MFLTAQIKKHSGNNGFDHPIPKKAQWALAVRIQTLQAASHNPTLYVGAQTDRKSVV